MDMRIKCSQCEIEEVLGLLRKIKNRKTVKRLRISFEPGLSKLLGVSIDSEMKKNVERN